MPWLVCVFVPLIVVDLQLAIYCDAPGYKVHMYNTEELADDWKKKFRAYSFWRFHQKSPGNKEIQINVDEFVCMNSYIQNHIKKPNLHKLHVIKRVRIHNNYYYVRICTKRAAESWVFHESPVYPHMYCFLAWKERMESSTEKTLCSNTIVIGDFLNLGSVSLECRQYQFLCHDNVTKGWRNFFQWESHQRVFDESCSFWWLT